MPKNKFRALSKSELAVAYGVSYKTFISWMKPYNEELGKYRGRAYTPKQMEKLVGLLGEPKNMESVYAH